LVNRIAPVLPLRLTSNKSGFWPVRQESLSQMPQTVMPLQRDTARQAGVTWA
jgi:hypothetical protein